MNNTLPTHTESGHYYSQMLLRQHPWLSSILKESELPVALSYRKPEKPLGFALLFIGCFVVLEALLHPVAFGGMFPRLILIFIGAIMIYTAFWALHLVTRSYVLVTTERLIYQKASFLRKPGKMIILPRYDIQQVRFLKGTVMYYAKRSDGDILVITRNRKSILISGVRDAENILESLR